MFKKLKFNLGVAILVAMILGILAGIVMGKSAVIFSPLGKIFINLIKMLVIPLVVVSIISGAAAISGTKSAGKVGIITFVYYLGTTALAVMLGLFFGEMFQPGIGIPIEKISSMFSMEYANKGNVPGVWDAIIGIIPTNPFKALIEGHMLQILFFSLFIGFAISALKTESKKPLLNIIDSLNEALIWMIHKVMLLAPLGVFGLMADAVGTFGYDILSLVLKLLVVYSFTLILQTYGVYPLLVKLFSKMNPLKFIKKISKAQIVALSTSSSMATLPMTFEVVEEELEVSNETTSFVLPLGATINMDGNSIYYALAAVFFAQLFGVELGIAQYGAIIITATIGSIGQAGVPGPSLLVVAVLIAAGLPVEGVPLLFGVDRIFDMMRTAVNITGDATCAVIVDNLANE